MREIKPGVVGLSGLLVTAFDSMRQTIKLLRDEGIQTPVVIGGGTIDEDVCRYTGADYWVTSAEDGVKLCKKILKTPNENNSIAAPNIRNISKFKKAICHYSWFRIYAFLK